MRMLALSKRNILEIIRDPLNLFFGLCFPVALLALLSVIQKNIPVPMFEITRLSPGIAVFGLSFMTLFSASLVSKDRSASFLQRLYVSPLTASDFIFGYILPVLPICIAQCAVCFAAAVIFGLKITPHILTAVIFSLPAALFFLSLGLLFGSVLTDKQVGGVCGALLTNLTAWLSGVWFDLDLLGGAFKRFAALLPFVHAVELLRAALRGDLAGIFPHIWWVTGYAAATAALAIFAFLRQMKNR